MTGNNLLITEGKEFSSNALSLLTNHFNIKILKEGTSIYKEDLTQINFLWIRLHEYIGVEILNKAPHLKAIITATTGLDCIDLNECEKRNIQIVSLANEAKFLEEIKSTAELTIALLFLLLRNIVPAINDVVSNGNWDRDAFKGYELYGKTVGIIGYGRLGKIVAGYLKSFGTKVLIYDPYVVEKSKYVTQVSLEKIFTSSDIISIHAKHTIETHKMITADLFSLIQKPIYFINTARGEIVDEKALLKALEQGKIKKAAIDVISSETKQNIKNNKLIKYAQHHDNLIITPHLGGCCYEPFEKTELFIAKKLIEFYCSSSSD